MTLHKHVEAETIHFQWQSNYVEVKSRPPLVNSFCIVWTHHPKSGVFTAKTFTLCIVWERTAHYINYSLWLQSVCIQTFTVWHQPCLVNSQLSQNTMTFVESVFTATSGVRVEQPRISNVLLIQPSIITFLFVKFWHSPTATVSCQICQARHWRISRQTNRWMNDPTERLTDWHRKEYKWKGS